MFLMKKKKIGISTSCTVSVTTVPGEARGRSARVEKRGLKRTVEDMLGDSGNGESNCEKQ